jgi:hypothetical protein
VLSFGRSKQKPSQRRAQPPPELGRLKQGVEETPKEKSRFLFLFRPWPWIFILGLFIWQKVGAIESKVEQALTPYSRAPVLGQVGPDGKPILLKQFEDGALNTDNVKTYAELAARLCWRFDRNLPKEVGGGLDPGVQVEGITDKIPTPIDSCTKMLDPVFSEQWLPGHLTAFPKGSMPPGLWRGQKAALHNLRVHEPKQENENQKSLIISGFYVIENENGVPAFKSQWARKFFVETFPKPKYVLNPSPIEAKYNQMRVRGLVIVDIQDGSEVLDR